jgi:nucleoid-associated protein YgaU
MAAIPYLWYWIIGSLVAVLIATVAIFSENLVEKNIVSKVEENKEISTENENPSEGGEDQSDFDQQKTVVQEPTVADDKVEGDLEAKEDKVSTEKPSDNQTIETKSSAYPPLLETARVDDDGTALVAGSAYPGSILEILIDETVVETIKVGQDGKFAVLFDLELKDTPQVISIRSIESGEILVSEETMIVAPKVIELAQATPVDTQTETRIVEKAVSESEDDPQKINETVSEGDTSTELPGDTVQAIENDGSDEVVSADATQSELAIKTPQLPQPTQESIEEAENPTVLLADNEGVKVVQNSAGPNVMTDVLFDTINYSKDGGVAVTGRGRPEAIVRFYLDNSPVASTAVDQQGYWTADLSDVKAGVYTLRLDQLDQTGKVSSRIESPFKREDREVLAGQIKDTASPARINVITVQPGNTLWAISRERYGRGILYVQVFDANKDKIRDPNLIYPGQIFDLPDEIKVN